MPSFELTGPDGGTYKVDAPDEHAALAAFSAFHGNASAAPAAPAAPPPDKYQQAAIDERKAIFGDTGGNPGFVEGKLRGATSDAGFTRRLAHGLTMGADSTILAGLETPLEMIRHGTLDPREGYNYAKAREDQIMGDARANTGVLGTGTEVLGGAAAGAGLAKQGVTAARFLAPEANVIKRASASALDGLGFGTVSGAMEGNGLEERASNAVKGGATGAAAGGILPLGFAGLKTLATPVVSNIRARINPEGFAQSQVARGVKESGRTAQEIQRDVDQAALEGQDAFTVADAMGNSGQRLLSTATRGPGEGRTMVVNQLNERQADQGRRLASTFREGFDAPRTAEQTGAAMKEVADFEAGHNYAPVKRDTTAIDVTHPVALANQAISPAADNLARAQGRVPTDLAGRAGIESQEAALRDPIGQALKEARSYLAAPSLTVSNVNQAFRAKTNMDMMIAKATEDGKGALVGELMPIRDALDERLAATSSNYANARDTYRVAQARIKALDVGKEIGARPGRPEDAIGVFRGLQDAPAEQAFRVGYADPQISHVANAPFGSNKAMPFTSDATRAEFNAFAAPGRADQLQRKIGRENTMFDTRQHAMGGSKTVDNLADEAAMGVDPTFVGHILTGNIAGAAKQALHAGANAMTGNTPAVRAEVAKILLQRGGSMSNGTLERMVDQTIARMQQVEANVANLTRGLTAGATASRPGQQRAQ